MRTLEQTIDRLNTNEGVKQTIRKHLYASDIHEWEDFTRSAMYDLQAHIARTLAPNSQKTVMAHIKCLLKRAIDEVELPNDYDRILVARGAKPLKTYLTEEDLEKFAAVRTTTLQREYVKNMFLICAYTGLRVSDARSLTMENIVGENLHYVAKKTNKIGAIPLKHGLKERIEWIVAHPEAVISPTGYNKALRRLCRQAGIDEEVLVFKGGKELRGPKWKFVSSHTARISTATCLSKRGVQIGDICQLLQHSSVQMTERYIIRDRVELSEAAMKFFA